MITSRGPDDEGFWVEPSAGLAFGFRRLAIIDLSAEGAQPMHSHDGRFSIVYNGEIYNHHHLRELLENQGVTSWRGHSDTEVLVEAIARWGFTETLSRLNGMFALAVWDHEARTLLLARDRIGEKPLYYARLGGVFLFGSELKALKANPAWTGEVDWDALTLFMRHAYIPAPYSAYRGVMKLPPGCWIAIREDGTHDEPVSYWDPRERAVELASSPFMGGDDDAEEALDALIRDSVVLRSFADVPVGAFLSGGIDSSTVSSVMAATATTEVKTFSIGFPGTRYDEAPHAAAVAKHLGTDHTELPVTSADCLAVLSEMPGIYDEPFADASQIPTLVLSRLTRQHVTVGLSGDGGDELFAGYGRFTGALSDAGKASRTPQVVRSAAGWLSDNVPRARLNTYSHKAALKLTSRGRNPRLGDKLSRSLRKISNDDVRSVYTGPREQWRAGDGLKDGVRCPATAFDQPLLPIDPLTALTVLDAQTYLPDDLLVKIDRASMATGLEARAPLLDHRIIEFAWSLPADMKVREGKAKWLLRRVLGRYIPASLIDRPKQGFEPPVQDWLRGDLREWAEDLLSEQALGDTGILDVPAIRDRWAEHSAGHRNWTYPLWTVLMLQAWREHDRASA